MFRHVNSGGFVVSLRRIIVSVLETVFSSNVMPRELQDSLQLCRFLVAHRRLARHVQRISCISLGVRTPGHSGEVFACCSFREGAHPTVVVTFVLAGCFHCRSRGVVWIEINNKRQRVVRVELNFGNSKLQGERSFLSNLPLVVVTAQVDRGWLRFPLTNHSFALHDERTGNQSLTKSWSNATIKIGMVVLGEK